MAKRKRKAPEVETYRHDASRKNIPPATMAAHGKVQDVPPTRYFYDPHLPPVLRFDESGEDDRLPELLEKARQEPLTDDEAHLLAKALRDRQLWLEWAGKRDKRWFDVDPVVLEIKGMETEQDRAKHEAARRWTAAVNNWGELGQWRFHVCKDPQTSGRELGYLVKVTGG